MADGGLGQALVGDKIMINSRHVSVTKLLGEGGFSYVYLVKEISDASAGQSLNSTVHGTEQATQRGSAGGGSGRSGSFGNGKTGERRSIGNASQERKEMVLKVTSILSRQQRDIAEKEAKLLSRLSHPSIIKMFDTCYRTVAHNTGKKSSDKKERPQHLILMEFCEGGHALDVCTQMVGNGTRFDLSTLIIAFGQICNAVSYLHAQRPPIVHRDLKPANFLVKNGAYKLCDFGSAVFGHVDLKTPKARQEAEEVIEKTTTQMFRAPEMVDLYMAKKLTQATDVWALGCCLYSLAFLQNCFEEGSNLAILSRKYKIPDDNPYGDGLVELIDRMLTVDSKARADMTEVILCLSAVYSGRPLPPRKVPKKKEEKEKKERKEKEKSKSKNNEKAGTFRTTAQGVYGEDLAIDPEEIKKQPAQVRKVDPNSALARRLAAAGAGPAANMDSKGDFGAFPEPSEEFGSSGFTEDPFASFDNDGKPDDSGLFASFDDIAMTSGEAGGEPSSEVVDWGNSSNKFDAFSTFSPDEGVQTTEGNAEPRDDSANRSDKGGETGDDADESGNTSRRKSSRPKSRSSDEGHGTDEGGDSDHRKKDRGTLRRTRSGSRRSKKISDDPEDLNAVADAGAKEKDDDDEDEGADGSKQKHSSRRSSKGTRLRRAQSGSDEVKDMAEGSRKKSHSSRRSSKNDEGKEKEKRREKERVPKDPDA